VALFSLFCSKTLYRGWRYSSSVVNCTFKHTLVPPPSPAMNSTPAASRAARIAARVVARGRCSPCSRFRIVSAAHRARIARSNRSHPCSSGLSRTAQMLCRELRTWYADSALTLRRHGRGLLPPRQPCTCTTLRTADINLVFLILLQHEHPPGPWLVLVAGVRAHTEKEIWLIGLCLGPNANQALGLLPATSPIYAPQFLTEHPAEPSGGA
jgi:hypothetical protein